MLKTETKRFPRLQRLLKNTGPVTFIVGILLGTAAPARAQTAYVRIEEDWRLEVAKGDGGSMTAGAPHIIVQMAPSPTSAFTGIFQINHRELPTFNKGGVQIQLLKDNAILSHKSRQTASFPSTGDTLTWTQSMSRNGSTLKYRILNANSATWGKISLTVDDEVDVDAADTKPVFDGYSSDYSVNNSAITFGATRVKVLKLIAVRKYKSDGTVDSETGLPKTVYPQN